MEFTSRHYVEELSTSTDSYFWNTYELVKIFYFMFISFWIVVGEGMFYFTVEGRGYIFSTCEADKIKISGVVKICIPNKPTFIHKHFIYKRILSNSKDGIHGRGGSSILGREEGGVLPIQYLIGGIQMITLSD